MGFSPEQYAVPAALLGVGLHLGYFMHGEHHTSNAKILLFLVLAPPALSLYFLSVSALPLYESVRAATILLGAFVGSLTGSILVYRCFFHPLRNFPGPFAAKSSKWWQVAKTLRQYKTFELLDTLHSQYGDFVRTGPNELSIIDPAVVEAVYGARSKCSKSPWYDMSLPITSVHQMRDRAMHDKRRRGAWDKAFNTKSLRAYDSRVVKFADLLVQKLDSFTGKPVDATEWFNFYSYDVMGSLGFGRSFNTLETGGSHKFIDILQAGTFLLRSFGCVAYLINLCMMVPGSSNPITQLNMYSDKCVDERKGNESAEPDILGHLIQDEEFFGNKDLDHGLLLGDARLVIVAGSDTTAAALTYLFYFIAKDPMLAHRLRTELQENDVRNDGTLSVTSLQDLPLLNGVINEALRLHPPVPGGVFRTTPPEGLQVGDKFLPGNVNTVVPVYSLQRSPKNFVDPNSFIPERWSTKPELIINKNAFLAFSAGPYSCIGRQLAMNELRTVASKLLLEFDVRMAPQETGTTLLEGQRDNFTLNPGKMELCFVKRGELN